MTARVTNRCGFEVSGFEDLVSKKTSFRSVETLSADEILSYLPTIEKRQQEFLGRLTEEQFRSLINELQNADSYQTHKETFRAVIGFDTKKALSLAGEEFGSLHMAILSLTPCHSNVYEIFTERMITQYLKDSTYPLNFLLLKNLSPLLIVDWLTKETDSGLLESDNFKEWMKDIPWFESNSPLQIIVNEDRPEILVKILWTLPRNDLNDCFRLIPQEKIYAWITKDSVPIKARMFLLQYYIEHVFDKGFPICYLRENGNDFTSDQVSTIKQICKSLAFEISDENFSSFDTCIQKIVSKNLDQGEQKEVINLAKLRIKSGTSPFLALLSVLPYSFTKLDGEMIPSLNLFFHGIALLNIYQNTYYGSLFSAVKASILFSDNPLLAGTASAVATFANRTINNLVDEMGLELGFQPRTVVNAQKILTIGTTAASVGLLYWIGIAHPLAAATLLGLKMGSQTDLYSYMLIRSLFFSISIPE